MQQYLELLKYVLEHGESHDDRTGVGTLSVFGYQFRHDMRKGFPLLTTKRVAFRWIAEELFWFLSGSTDEKELEAKGVDIWKEWATQEQCEKFGRVSGDLGPIYGFLWRNFGGTYVNLGELKSRKLIYRQPGTDQIARLMYDIENNPNSRRHLVSGWDPARCDEVALPPCHTLWQIKIHPNRFMSLHLYARSIDSFLGLPFNIASYGLLLTLIAYVTNYEPKDLIISFGDLHIYKNHLTQVREQLSREPRPLPRVQVVDAIFAPEQSNLDKLLSLRYKNLTLINYAPHASIKAPVAV